MMVSESAILDFSEVDSEEGEKRDTVEIFSSVKLQCPISEGVIWKKKVVSKLSGNIFQQAAHLVDQLKIIRSYKMLKYFLLIS